jgi:hypothetical protein
MIRVLDGLVPEGTHVSGFATSQYVMQDACT